MKNTHGGVTLSGRRPLSYRNQSINYIHLNQLIDKKLTISVFYQLSDIIHIFYNYDYESGRLLFATEHLIIYWLNSQFKSLCQKFIMFYHSALLRYSEKTNFKVLSHVLGQFSIRP